MSERDPEGFGLGEKSEENQRIDFEVARAHARDVGDLRKVLSYSEGRRVIWKQLKDAGIFRDAFTLNSNQTAYALGQKERGLALLELVMEADPNAFYQMHREAYAELKSKQKQKEKEES